MEEIWTEKYRPKTFKEIVGQEEIITRLEALVKKKSLPHCIFAGPAGTGKTTTALVIARTLFGKDWQANFTEMNASDERGIDTIRTKVKDFARTRPIGHDFKIIYLDEADALTRDAQQALRRTMEKYSDICRFILGVNYISKLIPPIQSRTAIFKFRPLDEKAVTKYLKMITKKEKLHVDEKAYKAIFTVSEGDLRRATNILQAAAALGKKITEKTIYDVTANPNPDEVKKMLKLALEKKFEKAREVLIKLLREQGLAGEDVIKEIHRQIFNLDIDNEKKARMIEATGDCEFRLTEGANDQVQLEALLARFMVI